MHRSPHFSDPRLTASAEEAVSAAYDAYQQPLYSFLLAATRDRQLAEDLLQETFVRLVYEASADRLPLNVRAWLYRVAANLAVSQHRRRGSAERWQARQGAPEAVTSAEERYLRREQQRQLLDVLGELPAAARLALLMAAHGFSGTEIARAIGRSPLATRALLCRARLRLRTRLSAEVESVA